MSRGFQSLMPALIRVSTNALSWDLSGKGCRIAPIGVAVSTLEITFGTEAQVSFGVLATVSMSHSCQGFNVGF